LLAAARRTISYLHGDRLLWDGSSPSTPISSKVHSDIFRVSSRIPYKENEGKALKLPLAVKPLRKTEEFLTSATHAQP